MSELPYFTEEHHQVRDLVRDFAESEIKPVARELDLESRFPWQNVKKMGELGLLGAPWEPELGGSGMDYISYITIVEELARVDASHAITCSAHTTLGTSPIVQFGSDDQKERYVPPLATGRVLGGFGLTEPGAGSDAGGTQTFAEDKGDHFVLNGSKIFITHAGVGEIFVVTARTERNPAKRTSGITSFIVTKDTTDLEAASAVGVGHDPDLPKFPGVKAGKKEDKMGWRASDTRELILEDAVVPKENVLGEPGMGFINFLKTLDSGRIGVGALALGLARGALDESVKYTTERKQFGQTIASFQATQFALADMATEIEAARHLVYHAAWLYQNGEPHTTAASMAKLFTHGQAVYLRSLYASHHQGGAVARRLRLHHRVSGRAHDA
jgi:butyryl-CoA dehydrogenase